MTHQRQVGVEDILGVVTLAGLEEFLQLDQHLGVGKRTEGAIHIMRTSRFRGLAAELRCLVCQNQTLLDSHADLAKDLRMEVVRLIQEGRDDAEVKRYLVDRYGEFVLYRPTWSWRNGLLWLGPLVLLAVAGAVIWRLTHKQKPQEDELDTADDTDDSDSDGEDDETPPLSTEDAMKQVDALLARTAEEPAAPTHESSRKTDGQAH